MTADVTSERSLAELAAAAAEAGVLGALVHTAGLSPVQAPWETVVSVNLTGTALLLAAFEPLARPGSRRGVPGVVGRVHHPGLRRRSTPCSTTPSRPT